MTDKLKPGEYRAYTLEKGLSVEDSVINAVDQFRQWAGEIPKIAQLNLRHETLGINLSDIGVKVEYRRAVTPGMVMLGNG